MIKFCKNNLLIKKLSQSSFIIFFIYLTLELNHIKLNSNKYNQICKNCPDIVTKTKKKEKKKKMRYILVKIDFYDKD